MFIFICGIHAVHGAHDGNKWECGSIPWVLPMEPRFFWQMSNIKEAQHGSHHQPQDHGAKSGAKRWAKGGPKGVPKVAAKKAAAKKLVAKPSRRTAPGVLTQDSPVPVTESDIADVYHMKYILPLLLP